MNKKVASELAANPEDPRHGTMNGYINGGCRCAACKKAGSEHNASRSGYRKQHQQTNKVHTAALARSRRRARWAANDPTIAESDRNRKNRRRARVARLPVETYSRCDIVRRDDSVSWLTGLPVDAADTSNVHVDHLIPLNYYLPGHPGDTFANVALCEGGLNSGRKDALTSEAWQQFGRNVIADVPDVTALGDVLGEVL